MNIVNSKQVLIINVHSILNAGDSSLLWLNMQQLEKVFSGAKFTALVNFPNEPYHESYPGLTILSSPFALIKAGSKDCSWLKIVRLVLGCLAMMVGMVLPTAMISNWRSEWVQLAICYRSADIVAAVSGAQLVSLGKYSWPLIVSSLPLLFAELFHCPIYIMPQSIGPFRWKWEKSLVRTLYSKARMVFLRDKISMRLAKEIGIPEKKVRFSSDPGFVMPTDTCESAFKILTSYGYKADQNSIGLTVVSRLSRAYHQDRFDAYYRTLASTLDRFSQAFEARIYIFDQVTGPTKNENDQNASELLIRNMAENQTRVIHVDRRLNPFELKACYSLMDLFIASRLHSGIFAMSSGVPTLFIGYNPKTRGVLEAVGLDQWMVDLDKFDGNQFWDLLCKMWNNRADISEKTRMAVQNCLKDFDRVSDWIAEDYFHARKS